MNGPATDIANLLNMSGVSLGDFGIDLFVNQEPVSPDNCITVYDTGGFDPESGYDYQRPTIMIKVRNRSYTAGYTLAYNIKQALHDYHNHTLGHHRYIGVWCMGDVNSIGLDDNNRSLLTVNFRVHRTQVT